MLKKEILGYHARHYTYGKKKNNEDHTEHSDPLCEVYWWQYYTVGIFLLITDG